MTYKVNNIIGLIIFLVFLSSNVSFSQSEHTLLMDGDAFYEQGDYAIAEEKYRKAGEEKNTLKSQFNLGNSLYQQNRYEEAVSQFEKSSQQGTSNEEKANANYNLGNTLIKGGQLEPAIEAYKRAIQQNPKDMDARRNLYLAKLMQQEQQEQEQQQQQQEQNEEQNQQDQSESQDQQQEQQEQQQQDEQSSQEEQQQSEESQIDNENESSSEESQQLSKEDAAKLLQISENDEKKVQEKLRKVAGSKKKPEKDW